MPYPLYSIFSRSKSWRHIRSGILQQSRSGIDDEVQKNRTMHEMARVMHVISDSDNTAALSKALGRYSRLDLDREHSKLDEEIEVNHNILPLLSFPTLPLL